MKPFAYESAPDTAGAVRLVAARHGAKFLAGGTNLVDLMREEIEQPELVVDVRGLPLGHITASPAGGLTLGAGATNTAVANDRFVRKRYPLVAQAILSGASGQIRNMATVGGNLLQRTRCAYFYDRASRCNKRAPGAGCDALEGFNRYHAILGASEHCIAVHPSDLCVALAALDTTVHTVGPTGVRTIPFEGFHRLPGRTPHVETVLSADELITAVEIAPLASGGRSVYRKLRDRSSYAFALVSVAAVLEIGDGMITAARLALGGVAHAPWRASRAEQVLFGAPATSDTFRRAAEAELAAAVGRRHNAFKIGLARHAIVDVLEQLASQGGAR